MKKTGKAFTLAEVMIVLTIIGILTAIIMPAAFHSTPNEDIMKFKKANVTLSKIVKEMASNGKYYKIGDLRNTANGGNPGDNYMCQVIADLMTAKTVDCANNNKQATIFVNAISGGSASNDCSTYANRCTLAKAKTQLDYYCASVGSSPKGVTTTDDVIWYETKKDNYTDSGNHANPECDNAIECNCEYKVLCLKISNLYFGYGIRSDGKVISGYYADEYINKSLQDN